MSEQDRDYIFTEDAKKAMVERSMKNKRENDQAPIDNTHKRHNNVLAATKARPNKQMRPMETKTEKVNTPKPTQKTTEAHGQTAKEAGTHKSKKIHGRDTPKTQPNSIKHSKPTNRYNCQEKGGIYTTTQNNTTTQEQDNSTPQPTQTYITSAQKKKKKKAYYPIEAKNLTHLTTQDTTSGEETEHYGREVAQHTYLNRSIDHDNEIICNETELEIETSQPTHTTANANTDTGINYPNKNKARKTRKSIRERNALHAIYKRGKREINFKFNTKHSKTLATKPEQVTTSET